MYYKKDGKFYFYPECNNEKYVGRIQSGSSSES